LIFFIEQAKTSAAGDHDGAVVERVVRFRDAAIGTGGSRVDLGGAFHGEGFMGPLVVEFLEEGVELGLLLQDVGACRASGFFLQEHPRASGVAEIVKAAGHPCPLLRRFPAEGLDVNAERLH
jgi:hypothetical protein